jgi:phosphoribosylformylglycinamidine synthase
MAIAEKWEVRATVIGHVTGSGRLRVIDADAASGASDGASGRSDGATVLADVPAKSLEEDAPLYDRERRPPADLAVRRADTADALPAGDPGADLAAMLADTSWVWSQYDHMLFLNTVAGPGADAAVLRLKHPTTGVDTGRGLALTTDGNHLWCAVDPRAGAAMTVVESAMNLAVAGARPVAMVNCLNFGNPEHPEVMWQFSEAVDGFTEALDAFGVPCIGGNVSFYNESGGADIDPTPIIGVLGVVDSLDRPPPGPRLVEGGRLVVVGEAPRGLSGSLWAASRGHRGRGELATTDLSAAAATAALVRDLVRHDAVVGAHDVAQGGLGLAVAEMAVASGTGATLARVADHVDLFSEAPGRVVLCVDPEGLTEVLALVDAAGVPHARIGLAGGDRLSVKGLADLPLAHLRARWSDTLPDALGSGTTQG